MSVAPHENLYAPPAGEVEPIPEAGSVREAVAIRRLHVGRETWLQGLGALWLIGGTFLLTMAVVLTTGDAFGWFPHLDSVRSGLLSLGLVGAGACGLGLDLHRLLPRARVTGSVGAAVFLLAVPLGTLFGLWILFLLHGRKGRRVFRADYAHIRELTPELNASVRPMLVVLTSLLLAMLLALLLPTDPMRF